MHYVLILSVVCLFWYFDLWDFTRKSNCSSRAGEFQYYTFMNTKVKQIYVQMKFLKLAGSSD